MKYLASYIGSGLYTVNVHVADTDTGLYDLIEEAGTHRSQRAHLTDGLKTTKLFQVVNAFKGNKKTPFYFGRDDDGRFYQSYGSLSEFVLPTSVISTIGSETELNGIQNNLEMVHFLSSTPAHNIFNVIFHYLSGIEVLVLGSRSSLDLTHLLFFAVPLPHFLLDHTSSTLREANG
ncbi:hypothetical protein BDF21DRAFT_469050 [Thamnidium elegans]|nr:hypothetical protein BDF21DRAFT_469050 [Thamnidium elegans]